MGAPGERGEDIHRHHARTHAHTRARAISCAPLLRKPPDRIARQQNMVLASDGLSDRTVDVKEVFEQTIQNAEARNGKWYANASPQVQAKLCAAYEAEPYEREGDEEARVRPQGALARVHCDL